MGDPAARRRRSLQAEHRVGHLGLLVGLAGRVVLRELQVVEVDVARLVLDRADGHDARGGGSPERVEQQAGQREVPEVVRAELQLEPIGGLAGRGHHDPRVVDQQVKRRGPAAEVARERADRIQRGQVELAHLNPGVGDPAADLLRRLLALPDRPHGQHDARALAGQFERRDLAEARVGPRDHSRAAGLVGDLVGLESAHR